jgi:5S rRNA maturation endonuclease (ribonuclease M5)
MTDEITHQPCPNCDSTDAYSFNPEKGLGYCFSCSKGHKVSDRDDKAPQTPVPNADRSVLDFVPLRGLSIHTLKKFNCRGTNEFHQYVYPCGGTKTRYHADKRFTAPNVKTDQFFGQNIFPVGVARKLTITEGELDAMSVWQMLDGDERFTNPVVSLPSATPNKKLWTRTKPYLDSFDEIILCVDTDAPGNEVADKITRMFPNKVKRVTFGDYKDPNEMLMAGKAKEFKWSWINAKRATPQNVYSSYEDFQTLYHQSPSTSFVSLNWPDFDTLVGGLPEAHFTVLKAKTGIGKTEVTRYIEKQLLDQNIPIGVWHLEEPALRSVLGLTCYDLQKNVTRKDLIAQQGLDKQVLKSIEKLTRRDIYHQFYMNEDCTADDLIAQFNFMQAAYGCRFIIVEPVQDILSVGADDSKEAALTDLAVRISKHCAQTGLGVVMVAHTNDDNEIKYCRSLGQRASLVVNLERNKYDPSLVVQNTTQAFVEKNRPSSQEGPAGELIFDPSQFTLQPL